MARRELGTRSRLASLGAALALLLALAALLDGDDGERVSEPGPLRASHFIEALAEAGIEAEPTGRRDVCDSVESRQLVEYRSEG